MKKNFKSFALMAVALLAGLSSCSNDDVTEGVDASAKSVFIKLTDAASSRVASDPQTAGSINFASGTIYFADANGTIRNSYTLDASIIHDLRATGYKFENINGTASQVFVVGNQATPSTQPNKDGVLAEVLDLTSQADLANVNLWGEAALSKKTEATTTARAQWEAKVNLATTVARVEVTNIKGAGNIKSFKIQNIFMDDFYKKSNVKGQLNSDDFKGRLTDNTKYVAGEGDYNALLNGIIYDSVNSISNADLVVGAGEGKVWGYNIFAPKAGATPLYTPRIIIRLTDIETIDGKQIASPQFITIKGFNNGNKSENVVAGSVYNIGAGELVFTEKDLTPDPNMEGIDVNVTVTVPEWTVVPVKPEI